jgi:hypothetical protein
MRENMLTFKSGFAANTCAIALPIRPAPITAILLIFIIKQHSYLIFFANVK